MQREEDRLREAPGERRRRTRRAERHRTSQAIHIFDGEDLDAVVPLKSVHDVGHKTSRPQKVPKPGRRPGFKVWKTPFWKRRTAVRRQKARAERILVDEE